TNNQFKNLGGIQVFLRKLPKKWIYVEEELQGDISMLFELNFTHIKFILEATETTVQERPDAFDLIINISQHICFLEQKKEDTCKNLLYNNIIKLFQNSHHTKFAERSLLLEELFNKLDQYQKD
ncbi:14608_t:CDS:2, partial [Rhizophagus irregularis]